MVSIDKLDKLVGKIVTTIQRDEDVLNLTFNDGSTLIIQARSGPGADSQWYNWTEVTLNGETIINH